MQTPAPDAVRAALEAVARSRVFTRADRQARLLRHVVERAASGRADELKEYSIALEVFGRKEYDPKVDSLVRVEALQLRKRLAEYYDTEGRHDPVRIEIPKGSYVPMFQAAAAEPSPTSSFRAKWLVAGGLVVSLAAAGAWRWSGEPVRPFPTPSPSIAVLPFTDMSPARDLGAFCDGLTEELIHGLAGVDGLHVASRTSVFQHKSKERDIRRIGEELNVLTVLEGSVRREGRRVRVTAQLILVKDGFHLWSQTWDRELANEMETQRALTASIMTDSPIGFAATRRALVRQHSPSAEAWHRYLDAVRAGDEPNLAKAAELYRASLAADPNYALAWSALSKTLITLMNWDQARPEDVLTEAGAAARRALELDPSLSEAHQAWGTARVFQARDWREAERAFRRAFDLDPTNAEARYDLAKLVLNLTGRYAEAVDQLERAIILAPNVNEFHIELAVSHILKGDYARAAAPLERSRTLTSTAPATWVWEGVMAARQGQREAALQHFKRAVSFRRTAWTLGYLGHSLAQAGRLDEAWQVLRELGHGPSYELAVMYAVLGQKDRAFEALEKAAAGGSPFLMRGGADYRLAELRSDRRFAALMKQISGG